MHDEKKYFFDNPKNVKRLLHILYACCVVLLGLEFVIHRHVSHSWENLLGFYPLYGFVGCVVLVLVATWMRTFLMRPENYYTDGAKADAVENADTAIKSAIDEKNKDNSGGPNVDA